jgi:hypothetical protein
LLTYDEHNQSKLTGSNIALLRDLIKQREAEIKDLRENAKLIQERINYADHNNKSNES